MHSSSWYKVAAHIEKNIEKNKFDTWIRPLLPKDTSDKKNITLVAQNSFMLDFLEQHYKEKILSFAKKIYPSCASVSFILSHEKPFETIPLSSTKTIPLAEEKNILSGSPLNNQYTFDLFVAGSGNEFAKSVALAVAENPGKTKFNPLLIYGGSGLGKTHLMHAIANYIVSLKKGFSLYFTTSEELYFNFVEAIKNDTTKLYTDTFRHSDILLVDDIQFLAGKERTQEEFFYIFNTLYQQGKQIVLTSDVSPNTIKGLHDRLISRFQWGLCVDIQPPDLETRVAILKKKADRDNLSIPENILYYIAENITTNIRKLEGVIIRLLAYASITKTDITIELVKNIIGESVKKENNKISIEEIMNKISAYYKIPVDNIREKNRSKEVAHCRHVAMYMAKKYTNFSLKTIGLHFGGRDHSTVIHAIKTITIDKEKDQVLKDDIRTIIDLLENK